MEWDNILMPYFAYGKRLYGTYYCDNKKLFLTKNA